MDDDQLRTVWQQRQFSDPVVMLAQPLTTLMKRTLSKRVRQLGRLGEIWDEIIPDEISGHTAIESFNSGVLKIVVDSAAHRFQLRLLLDGGLTREIQQRFKGPLNKIQLIPGQFCRYDQAGEPRYEF